MGSILGFFTQRLCSLMPFDDARSNVWEAVVRSGSVNVLRTQLERVDRNFNQFIGQLRLKQVFNIALGDMSWAFSIVLTPT